jgi:hypothetical protein
MVVLADEIGIVAVIEQELSDDQGRPFESASLTFTVERSALHRSLRLLSVDMPGSALVEAAIGAGSPFVGSPSVEPHGRPAGCHCTVVPRFTWPVFGQWRGRVPNVTWIYRARPEVLYVGSATIWLQIRTDLESRWSRSLWCGRSFPWTDDHGVRNVRGIRSSSSVVSTAK